MEKNRLTESKLQNIVAESVKNVLTELDYKTYANASRKRWAQGGKNMIKAQELGRMADKRFNDDYVGDWKYDTMGDKLKGKHSSTFDAYIDPTKDNIAYSAIKGKNKSGNDIFTTGKGKYHTGMGGRTTPGKHFRDTEIANAYSRANDELWDYADGNYEYQKGKGWNKK